MVMGFIMSMAWTIAGCEGSGLEAGLMGSSVGMAPGTYMASCSTCVSTSQHVSACRSTCQHTAAHSIMAAWLDGRQAHAHAGAGVGPA